jgi:plasmid stabilization system protein ParE
MSRRVRLTKEARKHTDAADAWWQQNRTAAPDAFWDEFVGTLRRLITMPETGVRVPLPRFPELRRVLLSTSENHVYYEATSRALVVWAVWGATRQDLPPISRPRPRRRKRR